MRLLWCQNGLIQDKFTVLFCKQKNSHARYLHMCYTEIKTVYRSFTPRRWTGWVEFLSGGETYMSAGSWGISVVAVSLVWPLKSSPHLIGLSEKNNKIIQFTEKRKFWSLSSSKHNLPSWTKLMLQTTSRISLPKDRFQNVTLKFLWNLLHFMVTSA